MTTDIAMTTQPAGGTIARALALLYGIVTYLFFFGTFLYLIGFVGNWVVPPCSPLPATGWSRS